VTGREMELNFVLEESHLKELGSIRVPKSEKTKRSPLAKTFRRWRVILGSALVFGSLFATFWAVKLLSGYELDGFSLFAGFVVGGALVTCLMVLKLRAIKNERVQRIAAQAQRCFVNVTPEMILFSRMGLDEVLSPKAVTAITQHSSVLVIWHPYGYVPVPRSAFAEGKSETEFLNIVRGASGSTLN
jgi:hypothetical protein